MNMNIEKKYPEAYFKTLWMLISTGILSAICVPIGIILDIQPLVGVGPLVGVIVGMLIGEKIEEKNKKLGRIRPLNDKEIRNRKILVLVILIVGLAGFTFLVFR